MEEGCTRCIWAFKDIVNVEIKTFCIFDRDYKTKGELDQFLSESQRESLTCRVWFRKEIRNYILDAELIAGAVAKKLRAEDRRLSVDLTGVNQSSM